MNIQDIINEFNNKIHNENKSYNEAYGQLMLDKNKQEHEFYKNHGFHLDMSYAYLYPEIISSF